MSLALYARAAASSLRHLGRSSKTAPQDVPELATELPAAVPAPRQLTALRTLFGSEDDGLVSPVWPYVASFPAHLAHLADPRFPLPLMGTIHIRTHLHQRRPLLATETLRLVAKLANAREGVKGLEFDLVTETFAEGDSSPVHVTTATMLRRSGKEPPPRTGVDRPALDGIGAKNTVLSTTPLDARRFAQVSGDINPIHLSAVTARLFGFRGMVLHGMWSVGKIAALHRAVFARDAASMSCDFKLPILVPARLVYRSWPEAEKHHFRLLDAKAEKPHAIGVLQPH